MTNKKQESPDNQPTFPRLQGAPCENTQPMPGDTSVAGGDLAESVADDVDPEVTGAEQLLKMMDRARAFEKKIHETCESKNSASAAVTGSASNRDSRSEMSSDYEVIREIARGGMGVVYEAWQRSLNRRVALKVILGAQLRSPSEIARFRAEAESVAKLDHPGVVPIYEIGVVDDTQFFSMGLYPRGSLVDQFTTERPRLQKAARIVIEIAETIQFTHSRNIIHRDLKPANVLLDSNDHPKVTDFGLAKDVENDPGLTLSGTILGTPAYMAPEQAHGRQEAVGQAADIYALGGVLYFLLTGNPPFVGETPLETIQQVIATEPRNPTTINSDVDQDLATIVLKCLQKAPEKRYASAQDVANDLSRWLRREPILARPITSLERTSKWIRRNPVISGLLTVTAMVLTSAIAGGVLYQTQLNESLKRETSAKGKAVKSAEETTRVLYESLTNEAQFLSEAQPPGFGRRGLSLVRQAAELETPHRDVQQLRGLAVANLGHASSTQVFEFGDYPDLVKTADITPDGRFLMVSLQSSELWIHDLTGELEIQKLNVPFELENTYVGVIRFPTPDEMLVAPLLCWEILRYTCDEKGIWGFKENVTLTNIDPVFDLKLSHNADYVVGLTPMSRKNILSLKSFPWDESIPSWSLQYNEPPKFCIRRRGWFDPSGSIVKTDAPHSLVFDISDANLVIGYPWNTDGDNSIHIYSLDDGNEIAHFNPGCGSLSSITVSRDGRYIACAGHQGLSIHDGRSGRLVDRPVDLSGCRLLGFTQDNTAVALLAGRLGVIVYHIASRKTESATQLPPTNWGSKTSSNGAYLLQTNSDLIRVSPLRPQEKMSYRAHEFLTRFVNFSPDGQLLLTNTDGGQHTIWDSESLIQICQFQADAAAFHPSGQVFATQRGENLQFWSMLDNRLLKTIAAPLDNAVGFEFSSTGKHLAVSSQGTGSLHVCRIDGLQSDVNSITGEWIFASNSALDAVFKWSPQGEQISWETNNGVHFKDFSDPNNSATVDSNNHRLAGFAIANSESLLYCQNIFSKLSILDTRTKRTTHEFPDKAIAPYRVSPDGRWLMARTQLYDLDSNQPVFELPIDNPGGIWDIAWSPDSRRCAIAVDTGFVEIWDLTELEERLKSMQFPPIGFDVAETCQPLDMISEFKQRWMRSNRKFDSRLWNAQLSSLSKALLEDSVEPGDLRLEIDFLLEGCIEHSIGRPFENSPVDIALRQKLYNLGSELSKNKNHAASRSILTMLIKRCPISSSPSSAEIELYARIEHTLGDLFNFSIENGREDAAKHYHRELQLRKQLAKNPDGNASVSERFWMHHNYSLALKATDRLAEAAAQLELAIATFEADPSAHPDQSDQAAKYRLLSDWYVALGEAEKAESTRQRATDRGLPVKKRN